jgi:O-methyltransferase
MDAMRRCSGEIAECGVYKGGTAKILAEIARDRSLYLFDTFSGMPDTDPGKDLHKAGDFKDTNLQSVREYLAGHPNVNCIAGMIPESLMGVVDRSFAFVHIDLDIYISIKTACEFFYPRIMAGGTLLFDDYGYPSCPGARTAVDEFFSDKQEIKIVMETGQCWVQKL